MVRRMSTLDLDRRLAEIAARSRARAGARFSARDRSRSPPRSAGCRSTSPTARPRRTAPIRSRSASPPAIRRRTASCCGRGSRREPLQADGGMPPRPVEVRWELAKDPGMRRIVDRGRATAWPAFAHSVHVEVERPRPRPRVLLPLHQRRAPPAASAARARRPAGAASTSSRSRSSTCQKWEEGFYPAYRAIAREDLDFVVHLGDYVYEYGIENGWGPRNPQLPAEFAAETETLDQYRLRHALYKTDRDLQDAHAAHPFVATWDDHEVRNDYSGDETDTAAPAARTPTAPTTSTCRCAATRSRTARRCRSTAASPGATSPSSACSTRASTAPTSRAATARPRAAPPRSSRARR